MDLHARLRILIDERPDAPRLRAGEELADHAPGRQDHRVLLVDVLRRRPIRGGVEARLAVGKVERPRALRHRIPRARLEEARRAGMLFARARPADAVLRLDLFVRDAVVVGDAALRRHAQLVEDLARAREREAARPPECLRDVLDHAPVLLRLARRIDRLVDLDHASLDLRDHALIFFMQRAGENDVGMLRGLAEEEVDDDEELELLERARDESVVGERDLRVEADRQEALDLAGVDLSHQLVAVDARLRQLLGLHAPDAGDVLAVRGVHDVAPAGELVALLPVLAAALAVALADDGAVRAVRPADAPRGENDVDRGEAVLHAVRVVLDAARVHEEARLRRPPQLRRRADRLLRDAGDLGGALRRPLLHVLGDRVEADGVLLDEVVIEPVVLDHQMEDAVEERDVAAGLDREEKVGRARDRRDARVDDDDLAAVLARLPDVVRRDGRALRGIRPGDEHDLGAEDVVPRVRRAVDAEGLLVRRSRAYHAEPAVVVD